MRTNADRNWDLIGEMLAAESSGKSPRLFSSRKTLFGIPSALDQELAALDEAASRDVSSAASANGNEEGESAETPAEEPSGKATDKTSRKAADKTVGKSSRKAAEAAAGKTSRKAADKATRVTHPLKPVYDDKSQTLILGTMPSPKSRETGFYYNHPQNRFWRVMAALFDETLPKANDEKRNLVLRHSIALWDVLAECTIEGASDGTIAECVPNNIGSLLAKAPIERIFCTGAKAAELYRKYCEPHTGVPAVRLPSTSPANAAMSLEQLIEAYKVILGE